MKGTGWLFTPPALATMSVDPGAFACAISWLSGAVIPTGSSVTEFVVAPVGSGLCQLNGPTDDVMSVLPLNAKAAYKVLSGLLLGPALERHIVESVGACPGTG